MSNGETVKKLYDLQHVEKEFVKGKDVLTIFDDLNIHVNKGDFIAIMGPSGSGKTTLLNMLGAVDRPTAGEVYFDGQRIDDLSESELSRWRSGNVGFIFQSYNLMPMLSAAKNVELPLMLTKMSKARRKESVKAALELVGLEQRADHSPDEMSGGQQQRVAIARAIVADPQLMLCDEPTGDLDRQTANEILDMLKKLNEDFGKTIIMVTHDAEAAKYAKTVWHLDKGKFVENGAAA